MSNCQPLALLFKQTIDGALSLVQSGGVYSFVEEKDKNQIEYEFESSTNNCFAFRFDTEEKFYYFNESPPYGVSKKCDLIFIVSENDVDYIIPVEVKSGKIREADKARDLGITCEHEEQISNGRCFCEWMVNLLSLHGYYSQKQRQLQYVGLLVWKVKPKLALKSTSVPRYSSTTGYNDTVIYEKTDRIIHLRELIKVFGNERSRNPRRNH